jgi:hypothetical protein
MLRWPITTTLVEDNLSPGGRSIRSALPTGLSKAGIPESG